MKNEIPLAELRRERASLDKKIIELEGLRWDVAWQIVQRECPVKVGQILYRPAFRRRYEVTEIKDTGSHKSLVAWCLRVVPINKDGKRRRRARTEIVYEVQFIEDFEIEEAR